MESSKFLHPKVDCVKVKSCYQYKTLPGLSFIITGYNCQDYIEDCLESVLAQREVSWRAFVIDDASEDNTWSSIVKYRERSPGQINAVRNRNRKGKMENFAWAVKQCHPEEVIVELDGDDYLLDENVGMEIAELHQHYDVVWTQHEIDVEKCPDWHAWYSTGLPWNWTRRHPWRPSLWTADMHPGHLRTFKCKYFALIDEEDLKWEGEYMKSAADAAYYTPIIELAPSAYRYFYARKSLCYRITTNNNTLEELRIERLRDVEMQSQVSDYVKSLPEYRSISIPTLFIPFNRPVNQGENLTDLLYRAKEIDRFAQVCVGVNSFDNLELPQELGVIHFFNIKKIFDNIFNTTYRLNPTGGIDDELFYLMACLYLLKNTKVGRLVAFKEPAILLDGEVGDLDSWINRFPDKIDLFNRCDVDLGYLTDSLDVRLNH
jgi:glycosyltransferase involved in cell wall biosynthesis